MVTLNVQQTFTADSKPGNSFFDPSSKLVVNATNTKQLATLMASWYLKIGWSMLPILPDGKRPPYNFGWKKYQYRQPTKEEVLSWLQQGWYLAVITGPISNLVIIDDDRTKNGLPEWGLTSSIIAKSENGGKHFYHSYDREIHSHNNKKNCDLHIDLKALGAYCLLPPFGNREWISKPSTENITKLIPVSQEIVELINPKRLILPRVPKPIPYYKPTQIKGETWIERCERAKKAPEDIYVYPYLNRETQTSEYIKSLCPFHVENTPSFYIFFPTINFHDFHFKCFGCNTYGIGMIAFHMQRKQIDFKEAVRELAP